MVPAEQTPGASTSAAGGALMVAAEPMPDGRPVACRDVPVGGQAVLEGVMMRGVSTWAVAVRKPGGEIEVTSEPVVSWAKRHPVLRLPVIRGAVALATRRSAVSATSRAPPAQAPSTAAITGKGRVAMPPT